MATKITDVKSHVLQHPLDKELGNSQGYFDRRTAHIHSSLTGGTENLLQEDGK